jgi:hypothetical protein
MKSICENLCDSVASLRFVPFVVIQNFRQSAMVLTLSIINLLGMWQAAALFAFLPSFSRECSNLTYCGSTASLSCQPNRGKYLKMPKMPKSVHCREQSVTPLGRPVSAVVTGSANPNSLTHSTCDGVSAENPWTPRPLAIGCQLAPVLNPAKNLGPYLPSEADLRLWQWPLAIWPAIC